MSWFRVAPRPAQEHMMCCHSACNVTCLQHALTAHQDNRCNEDLRCHRTSVLLPVPNALAGLAFAQFEGLTHGRCSCWSHAFEAGEIYVHCLAGSGCCCSRQVSVASVPWCFFECFLSQDIPTPHLGLPPAPPPPQSPQAPPGPQGPRIMKPADLPAAPNTHTPASKRLLHSTVHHSSVNSRRRDQTQANQMAPQQFQLACHQHHTHKHANNNRHHAPTTVPDAKCLTKPFICYALSHIEFCQYCSFLYQWC